MTFADLAAELDAAVAERERIGTALSKARAQGAPKLSSAVLDRLSELAMGEARFDVALRDAMAGTGSGPGQR